MMAAVSMPSLKVALPQGLNERLEQIMAKKEKKKKKTVSWPAEDKLCQVCLFAAEDVPSISGGMASQDLYQAKQTRFMHTTIPVSDSDDDLPPGFESMVSRVARLDAEAVQAMLPLPRWSCPPKIVHDPRWQVATGSESAEAEAQVQREVRVLEAVYPRLSTIPLSPSEPPEGANTDTEGSLEHEVPLAPIEDEFETEEDGVFFAADAKPSVSRNGFDSRVELPLLRTLNPRVPVAAAAAAYAALKSYERGQMIDNGLISKIFNSPEFVDTLLLSIKNPSESNNRVVINGAPVPVPGQIQDFVSNSFRSVRGMGGEITPPVMSTLMYNPPQVDYFKGYMRGPTDAHPGSINGVPESHFGSIRGMTDAHLGPIRGPTDAHLGHIRGLADAHLGPLRAPIDAHLRGPTDNHLGPISGPTDGNLGPMRGPTDAHLGPMRGPANVYLGPMRGPTDAHSRGPTDAHFGPTRGPTDTHFGPVRGPTDAHFGPIRGPTDVHLGPIRGPSDSHSGSFPISLPMSVPPPPSLQQLASGRPLAMGMMGRPLSGERQRVMAPGPSSSSGRPIESFQPEQFRSSAAPNRICFYYNTARGCRNGASCPFLHDPDRKRDHDRMAPDFFPPLPSMKRPRFNPASAFAVVMTNFPTEQGNEKPETEKSNQQPERRVAMEIVGDVENH